ncbi:MAG: GNAT family N-acetyltransferase [Candidatus Woesearchaeota archaeon]
MKIRRANQKDLDVLSNFVREANSTTTVHGHTLGKEYFKSVIRGGFVFVAEDQGNCKGILLADVDARIQFSKIIHVVVHPEENDEEIREALVNKHMNECKKMNICDIALQTSDKEKKTLKFFENMGFSPENKFVLMTRTI